MASALTRTIAGISAAAGAAIFAMPAAAAGSCGGFYAVDAPTSLAKVAQACRVTIASLREANPGVNPANVRPGEHLAVPISLLHAAEPLRATASVRNVNSTARLPFTEDLGFRARTNQRLRILASTTIQSGGPDWLRSNPTGGHYTSVAPLSFQKMAALRIETASASPIRSPILVSSGGAGPNFTRDDITTGGYRLPDYNKIGLAPPVLVAPSAATSSLTGEIVRSFDGCFSLLAEDGKIWRLAATPMSDDEILGQTVTVWGTTSNSNICGDGPAMNVSHAIYAEPWIEN